MAEEVDTPRIETSHPLWKSHEILVANLLSLAGYEVTGEQLVGHKKIDILACRYELGKLRRLAVECKDYSSNLGVNTVRQIVADYGLLYQKGLIDALLVVTSGELTAAAQTMIDESRFLYHRTVSGLRFSLIDFRRYLTDIENRYQEEGLHRYYIQSRCKRSAENLSDTELDGEMERWLENDETLPVALLGSYGSGKSTFLLHFAYSCARRYQQQRQPRIPILIPLSEICSEQTIEGLLGKHFTHLHPTTGYSFELFQALNKMGSFVILLDGFDEMKHSMTAAVFRYTFKEVLKLVTPHSKVILAGRPTAFLTDQERNEFLNATRTYRAMAFI